MENKSSFQDIMPSITIQIDFIGYFFLFASVIISLYLLKRVTIKFLKSEKKVLTKQEIAVLKIKELDLNSPDQKQLLYDFTLLCKEVSNQEKDAKLQKLLQEIEPYKYHSKNISISIELKYKIQRYIDELHL